MHPRLPRLIAPALVVVLGSAVVCASTAVLALRERGDPEAELEAEFARLHAQWTTPAPSAAAQAAWLAVEGRLQGILERVRAADTTQGGLAFAAPGMQNDEWAATLGVGLEARAELLVELAALLDEIAAEGTLVREPFDAARSAGHPRVPSDSLAALRSAGNLLCGQAWHVGRDPGQAAESARWLVRALTLARVTDDGTPFAFGGRVALDNIALECTAKLVDEARLDAERLCAPIRAELRRGAPRDRLREALECELLQLEWCFRTGRDPYGRPIEAGRRAEALQALHEAVRERTRQLAGDPDQHWQELSTTRVDTDTPALRNNLAFLAGSLSARETHIARVFPDGLGE